MKKYITGNAVTLAEKIDIRKFIFLITGITFMCLCLSCKSNDNYGIWKGSCINRTYGGSAPIEITIQKKNNVITGYISIKGETLGGSGEIMGMINGNAVTFNSPGDNDIMTGIQWDGVINGKEMNGTFLVNPSLRGISIGVQPQYGVFNAKKQ